MQEKEDMQVQEKQVKKMNTQEEEQELLLFLETNGRWPSYLVVYGAAENRLYRILQRSHKNGNINIDMQVQEKHKESILSIELRNKIGEVQTQVAAAQAVKSAAAKAVKSAAAAAAAVKKKKRKETAAAAAAAAVKKKKKKETAAAAMAAAKKAAASKMPKKDPNEPKRAMSSWMLFSKKYRHEIKILHPNTSFGDIQKLLGEKWRAVTAEEKAEMDKLSGTF